MIGTRRRGNDPLGLADLMGDLRAEYDIATQTRFTRELTGMAPGYGADWHVRSEADFLRMMEVARFFDRNDPIIRPAITRYIRNVVQDGFTLDVETGDDGGDKLIREGLEEWSLDPQQCDVRGTHTLHEIMALSLRATIVDGDCFLLCTDAPTIAMNEAHRCRTPHTAPHGWLGNLFKWRKSIDARVVHGVLQDEFGRPLQYWFTRDDFGPSYAPQVLDDLDQRDAQIAFDLSPQDHVSIPQVLHLADRQRITQTRGVTALAAVARLAVIHGDLVMAALLKAQLNACYGVTREQPHMGDPLRPGAGARGERTLENMPGGGVREIQGIGPGLEVYGRPGEVIKAFQPAAQSAELTALSKIVLTQLANNLDQPLVVMLMDASETNYSGHRGAVDQARKGWGVKQSWLAMNGYRPVWRWKLSQWATPDHPEARKEYVDLFRRLKSVKRYLNVWAVPPGWEYLEPNKDRAADVSGLQNAMTSRRRWSAKREGDWSTLYPEIVDDNFVAIDYALTRTAELRKKHAAAIPDLNLHWRELLPMPAPAAGLIQPPPPQDKSDDGGVEKDKVDA